MSDIIDFLEKMGGDARLRGVSPIELEEALKRAGLTATVRTAMLDADQRELESLLGARSNVCCLVYSPDKEEEEEEEEENEEEEDDEEEKEGKVKSEHLVRQVA